VAQKVGIHILIIHLPGVDKLPGEAENEFDEQRR